MGSGASVRDVKYYGNTEKVRAERHAGKHSGNDVDESYDLHPSTSTDASTESTARYMGLQPLSKEWHNQARFSTAINEMPSQTHVAVSSGQQERISEQAVTEELRASRLYIQGKGPVMTSMFQEKANICRYFDTQADLWVLLPLQLEMNIDFVTQKVKRVMAALPGLVDQKEITAALRQCNYDPDEVIAVYLTIFGDVLFHPSAEEQNYLELNSFRFQTEKDRVIEDLKQNLLTKENEAENLTQQNSNLAREVVHLSEVVQQLKQRLSELEADEQGNLEIRALMNHRPPVSTPPTRPGTALTPTPSVDLRKLAQVSCVTKELSLSIMQLRSTVHQALADLQHQAEEAVGAVEELRFRYSREVQEWNAQNNELPELQGNIQVFCRCRGNSGGRSCLDAASKQELLVYGKANTKTFLFDQVYSSSTSQEEVFEGALPIIKSCLSGKRVCILAYGQSGSGKTYTMTGTKDKPGVNIRSVRALLHLCNEKESVTYNLKISTLEIYNDTLHDLLSVNPNNPLEIRSQGRSISVPGLTHVEVKTEDDILNTMEMVDKNRKIGSTKMNTESSCSHLLLTLTLEVTDCSSGESSCGTLTLCDLAGPKHFSKTEATGQNLVEAAGINKSLTSLRQVFSALKSNAPHVPFRNSKLTHLLQPCLSGDAKCLVLMNVNPDGKNMVETLSTLQFGSTLRQIVLGKSSRHISPTKNKADKQQ